MEYTRRYLMDGLHNLRDLGGYAVPGGITRFGVLLRSDLPWHLTEDDGKRFAALEVRHTLDLRDVDESESMPDELALLRGVAYRQIAMKKVPRAVARNRPGGLSAFDEAFFWGDEYIRMLIQIRCSIDNQEASYLYDMFARSRDYRDSIDASSSGLINKTYMLYIDIVDEAGGIATIATILAMEGISIKNIGIFHNREFEQGVLKIEFYEQNALEKGCALLKKRNYIVYER